MPIIILDNLTDMDKAKMMVDQLKIEVKLERMKTSPCCTEFMDTVQATVEEDILVKGIPEEKNPFKEKGGCIIC